MSQTPDQPPSPDGADATSGSLEARLRAARERHSGQVPGPATKDPSPWGMGVRVGVEMLSALMVAVAIGWGLDRWLHTKPLFLAVFVLLGGAAGVMNVWRMVGPRAQDVRKR